MVFYALAVYAVLVKEERINDGKVRKKYEYMARDRFQTFPHRFLILLQIPTI